MTLSSTAKTCIIKIGVLAIVIASYYFIPAVHDFTGRGVGFLHRRDFEGLRQFILSYGMWAPVTSIALMALQSTVPLVPGLIITITNAWIFGVFYGAVYSWLGALAGAAIDFGIARWYGRVVVEKIVNKRYLEMTDRFFRRYGILAIFITRLTPIIPFKVVSYGSGLTNIKFFKYVLATAIGQTPAIFLYSLLGRHLAHSISVALAVTAFLVALGCLAYYYRDRIERYFFSDKD